MTGKTKRSRRGPRKPRDVKDLERAFIRIAGYCDRCMQCWSALRACQHDGIREHLLDAVRYHLIKVGEYVETVHARQQNFWQRFGEIHHLALRDMRNRLAHHGDVTEDEAGSALSELIEPLAHAIANTRFPVKRDPGSADTFVTATADLLAIPPPAENEELGPDNSLAMVIPASKGSFAVGRFAATGPSQFRMSQELQRVLQKIVGYKEQTAG